MTKDEHEQLVDDILSASSEDYMDYVRSVHVPHNSAIYDREDGLEEGQYIRENPDGTKLLIEVDDAFDEKVIKVLTDAA